MWSPESRIRELLDKLGDGARQALFRYGYDIGQGFIDVLSQYQRLVDAARSGRLRNLDGLLRELNQHHKASPASGKFEKWLSDPGARLWLSTGLPRMLLSFWDWVDRRVETIELLSDTRFARRFSVDLTMPAGVPAGPYSSLGCIVPLAFVRKRYLRGFDITDEAQHPLPVLTERQSQLVAAAMLKPLIVAQLEQAGIVSQHEHLTDTLERDVIKVPSRDGDQLVNELESKDGWSVVLQDGLIRALVRELASAFILFAVVEAKAGERRIIKYSYFHRFDAPARGVRVWRRVLRWLGWIPLTLTVDGVLPGTSASYHAEIATPPGAVLAAAELGHGDAQLDFDSNEPRIAHLRYSATEVLEARGPDAVVSGPVEIVMDLWPAKNEVLRQVSRGAHLVVFVLTAGLLIKVAQMNQWAGLQVHYLAQAASPVLVAVPAVVAFYLAVQEHPILQRLLYGTLMRAGIAAGIAFIAAASLTLTGYPPHGLLATWLALLVLALLNSFSLAVGRYQAQRLFTTLRARSQRV